MNFLADLLMDNPNPPADSVLQKMNDEFKDTLDPLIVSSIESLLEKTYSLQDDGERKQLLEETFKRGVELMQKNKFTRDAIENLSTEPVDDFKIEELILSCLEGREFDKTAGGEEEEGDKSDHAYSKRLSSSPYAPVKLRSKPEGSDHPSPSARSFERLEDCSKVISHNKVKKVMKSVSGSNPFVQRVSTATSTGLPKYMFTPRGGQLQGSQLIKTISSKSVKVEITSKKDKDGVKKTTVKQSVDASTDTGADKIHEKAEVKPGASNVPKTPAAAPKPDPPNTVVIKHAQQWTVGNFSKKMRMGNGKSIDSMFFSIRVLGKKTDWSLMLYPNGDKERVSGYLSLYLTCRNRRALQMSLEFKFSLLDGEGEAAPSPTKSGSISSQMLATNSSWGWESFVKQEDLKRNGLLVNNKVTICCDITLKIQDPDAVKNPSKDELVLEDDRDIDALVDFVGELSVEEDQQKKKKGKKNRSEKVNVELDAENSSSSSDEEDVNMETNVKSQEVQPTKTVEASSTVDVSDFQVVTRRRRKNSQSSSAPSPTGKNDKPEKLSKNKSKQKTKAASTKNSIKKSSPSQPQPVAKPDTPESPVAPVKTTEEKPSASGDQSRTKAVLAQRMSSICLDTKESLEELLKTKNLLEDNIGRLGDLISTKSTAIEEMTQDKEHKLRLVAGNQEQLRQQRASIEAQIEEQRKVISQLEANIDEVDVALKKGSEKEARLKIYLDMNILDAEGQLARLGKEKDDLEARLDQVENKLRGNRRKERLLTIHNQILRLQTNLECPICVETASSPIYQCKEVNLN